MKRSVALTLSPSLLLLALIDRDAAKAICFTVMLLGGVGLIAMLVYMVMLDPSGWPIGAAIVLIIVMMILSLAQGAA